MKKTIFCTMFAAAGMILFTGCASLENKSFAAAGGVDAMKVETSGSTSTGTILPNITVGGAVSAIATSPAMEQGKTTAPVFSKAKRNSFFGELFGIDCSTTALVYIGTPGETADETAKRMKAIQEIAETDSTKKNAAQTETKTETKAETATATETKAETVKTDQATAATGTEATKTETATETKTDTKAETAAQETKK